MKKYEKIYNYLMNHSSQFVEVLQTKRQFS